MSFEHCSRMAIRRALTSSVWAMVVRSHKFATLGRDTTMRKSIPRALAFLLTAVMLVTAENARAASHPNFLIILADDCTYNDLPLYGGQSARTPNIDKLAAEGLTF